MIIKKFVANTETEANALMRQELGPEAMVLTKRYVQPTGLRALFSSDRVEITAGVDPTDYERYQNDKELNATREKAGLKAHQLQDSLSDLKRSIPQESPGVTYTPSGRLAPGSRAPVTPAADDPVHSLKQATQGLVQHFKEEEEGTTPRRGFQKLEVLDGPSRPVKETLRKPVKTEAPRKEAQPLATDLEDIRKMIREEMQRAQESVSVGSLDDNEEEIVGSVRFLLSKGVARTIALEIEEKMEKRFGSTDMTKASKERTARLNGVKAELAHIIDTSGPIRLKQGQPTVVALVGPHGVGKTTTLAKLAIQYSQQLRKRVAIITLDTTKRGAKDQILGLVQGFEIPVSIAANGFQLQQELGLLSDRDLILIDTSGRNQYNRQDVDQIGNTLSLVDDIQNYLVISAATKDLDVLGTIQQFAPVPNEGLIFTKMDETIAYGLLVNICFHTGKSIAYVTNGVNVPGDIRLADADDIARSLLMHHNNKEFNVLRKLVNQ